MHEECPFFNVEAKHPHFFYKKYVEVLQDISETSLKAIRVDGPFDPFLRGKEEVKEVFKKYEAVWRKMLLLKRESFSTLI